MMVNPYPTPLDQAWLRFWVSIYGPDSKLAKYVLPYTPTTNGHDQPRPAQSRPARPRRQTSAAERLSDNKKTGEKYSSNYSSAGRRTPTERRDRKIDRDANRMHPLSDWAKRLIGDERIVKTTLDDLIDGIEDYFEIFDQIRKVDRDAYAYFSRVGAPLLLRNYGIWERQLNITIPNAGATLPSFFGAFVPSTIAEYREDIIEDKPKLPEFTYFMKIKNPATVAPLGSTIFQQHGINLKRNAFSKEELKRFPWAGKNFGVCWLVGVLPDGTIRALPQRMQHDQRLPRGGVVHTSRFQIPPGLFEFSKDENGVYRHAHQFASLHFAVVLAMTATAISGIHVTVRKGKKTARVGIPISAVKSFFADRELAPGQSRRKPIIHLRLAHDRYLHDGRIVTVGDHLAGERQFEWRGYQISVGASGIHYPSPEGFTAGGYLSDEPGVPDEKMVGIGKVAKSIEPYLWRKKPVHFRKGIPERKYMANPLDTAPGLKE